MRTLALALVTTALMATQTQAGLFFNLKQPCPPAPACKPAPPPVCPPAPACAKPCPIKAALKPVKLPKLCLPKIDLLSLFQCKSSDGPAVEDIPESDLGEAAEEGAIEESAADSAPAPKEAVEDVPPPPKEAPAPKAAPAPPEEAPAKADAKTADAKAPYVEKAAAAAAAAE